MSETDIEWTVTRGPDGRLHPGFTFNPWVGCEKVSPGCKNCYAEAIDERFYGGEHWGPDGLRKLQSEAYWDQPRKWNRKAERLGLRLKVFCASMADVFDKKAPYALRVRLWKMIAATPWLDWLLLTKRPENFELFLPWVPCPRDSDVCKYAGLSGVMCPEATAESDCCDIEDGVGRGGLGSMLNPRAPWANVWLGCTAENQEMADKRIPILLRTPAVTRFVSVEPQLEHVDLRHLNFGRLVEIDALAGTHGVLRPHGGDNARLDWVIQGCESGHGARPFDPAWSRSMRDDCRDTRVSYFLKQMPGERRGKKVSLPVLDGRTHEEQPR